MRRIVLSATMALACASPRNASDTAVATAVDTLKPSVVAAPGSASPTPVGASASGRPNRTPPTVSKTRVAIDTGNLGRDSVIRINPRDPKRQIPTKKP